MKQNHKKKVQDSEIIQVYNTDQTLHEAAANLGITVITPWRRAQTLKLAWKDKGYRGGAGNKIPLSDILNGKCPEYQTFKLKNRLIAERVKENKCEVCGITEWKGKVLTMQLDHIDGDPHNHKLNNLRMICPNCHCQTETWCGKNKS